MKDKTLAGMGSFATGIAAMVYGVWTIVDISLAVVILFISFVLTFGLLFWMYLKAD